VTVRAVPPEIKRIAYVVRLRKMVLHEVGVGTESGDVADCATEKTQARNCGGTLRQTCDTHHHTVHRDEGLHRRVVVAVDVAANESEGETSSCKLCVTANNSRKMLHVFIHGHDEAILLVFHCTSGDSCRFGTNFHIADMRTDVL